jgi:5'-3' exonuclease
MGIPNFLSHILNYAGREVDLQDYSDREEPLRVAIDISPWIHRACFAYSDLLADEKHLNNYGRNTLQYEQEITEIQQHQREPLDCQLEADKMGTDRTAQKPISTSEKELLEFIVKSSRTVMENLLSFQKATKAEVLIVLDGTTPPIKTTTVKDRGVKRRIEQEFRDLPVDTAAQSPLLERRFKANRRAGAGEHYSAVVDAVIAALRSEKIPFLVAPYEADAQLAFLQINKHVDLVITEDSDLIAYGLATPLLYRLSKNSEGGLSRGVLLRGSDLAATFSCNGKKNIINLTDFTPPMMACLFAALGCDYCNKLRGIGLSLACRDIRAAFFPQDVSTGTDSPLEVLLKSLLKSTWDRNKMTDDEKDAFEYDFLAAVFMYRHAMVFDPVEVCCRPLIDFCEADKEFLFFGPYAAIFRNKNRMSSIIGHDFPATVASHIAEGWICPKSLRLRENGTPPPDIQKDLDEFLINRAAGSLEYIDTDAETQPEIFSPNCKQVYESRLLSQAR